MATPLQRYKELNGLTDNKSVEPTTQPKTIFQIASELNSYEGIIDASAVRGLPKEIDIKEVAKQTIEEIKSSRSLDITHIKNGETLAYMAQNNKGNTGKIDTSDLRWHGAGLTSVDHDATLSGDGTAASPLSVITTTSGVNSINGDSTSAQTLTVGTSGTDFAIADNGIGGHTFNLPTASATNRGALSSADWTTFNSKGSGTVTTVSVTTANGVSGVVANATTTPAITVTLGAITPSTVNGNTITTGTGTLTLGAGKTLTVNNSIALSGTDSTVMTFPSTSATIARTDAANTFSGIQTITNLTLPDQGQIKLTVPTTDLKATGPTCGDFNCGYTSSAIGDLVYLDSSSTWQKTDANTLALYNGFLGIALEVKASGAALLVALPGSFIYSTTGFPTWTIGSPIYMSETAGAMTQTAPTTTDSATRVVGWGVHADKMYFFPSPDYITHT